MSRESEIKMETGNNHKAEAVRGSRRNSHKKKKVRSHASSMQSDSATEERTVGGNTRVSTPRGPRSSRSSRSSSKSSRSSSRSSNRSTGLSKSRGLTDDQKAKIPCKLFLKGKCKFGDKCKYLHEEGAAAPAPE